MASIERAYAAIDVNNLWHSCRDIFGTNARVNFSSLKTLISNRQYSNHTRLLTITAYAVTLPVSKTVSGQTVRIPSHNSRFLIALQNLGFKVKTRTIRIEKGLIKPFATDWDVGIALDAIEDQDEYDTFILVSGDGDFSLLLERLKKKGKRVEVITFQKVTSSLLHPVTDEMIFLTENEVFQDPGRRHESGANQEDPATD